MKNSTATADLNVWPWYFELYRSYALDAPMQKNVKSILKLLSNGLSLSKSYLLKREDENSFSIVGRHPHSKSSQSHINLTTRLLNFTPTKKVLVFKETEKGFEELKLSISDNCKSIALVLIDDNYLLLLTRKTENFKVKEFDEAVDALSKFGSYMTSSFDKESSALLTDSKKPNGKISDAGLSAIMDNSQESVIFFNVDGNVKLFNKLAKNHLNKFYKIKISEGSSVLNLFPKNNTNRQDIFKKAVAGKKCQFETKLLEKNKEKHFRITYDPVFSPDKKVIGVINTASDITEFVEKQNLLIEQGATLSSILGSSPAAVLALDKNFKIIYFNKKASQAFKTIRGYKLKIGGHIKEAYRPDYFEERLETIYNKLDKGESVNYTRSIVLKNEKKYFAVKHEPILSEDKQLIGYLQFIEDHTEVANTNAQMEQRELILKSVLDHTESGIIAYDLNFNLIYFNNLTKNRHKKIYDVNLKLGESILELMDGRIKAVDWRNEELFSILDESKEKITKIIAFGKADSKFMQLSVIPMFDKSGKLIGALEDGRDITEEVLSRKVITDQKATLNAVLDSTYNGIFAIDKEMNLLAINKQSQKDFGKINVDIKVGDNLSEKVDTETLVRWKESYFDKVFQGETHTYIGEGITPHTFVENIYNPVINDKNEIIGCLELSRDITESRIKQKALEDSEKRFRSLVEYVPTGIVRVDLKGMINYVSPRVLKMLGYQVEDFIGKAIHTFLSEDDIAKFNNQTIQLIKGRSEIDSSFKVKSKERGLVHIEGIASLTKDSEGNPYEFLLAFNDITDKIKVQENLISTKGNYELLFKNMYSAIIYYDFANDVVLDHNNSALTLLKLKSKELIGMKEHDLIVQFSDYMPGIDFYKKAESDLERIKEGKKVDSVRVLKNSEGVEILTNVTMTPSFDDSNKSYVLYRDITQEFLSTRDSKEKTAIYETLIENSSEGIDIIEYTLKDEMLEEGKLIVRNENMSVYFPDQSKIYDQYEQIKDLTPELQPNGQQTEERMREISIELLKERENQHKIQFKVNSQEKDVMASHVMKSLHGKMYLIRNFKDVTDQLRADQIIKKQLDDLNLKNIEMQKYISSNLQLENFAYIASHDLKAPIRSVISFMQLLRKNVASEINEKNLKFIDIVLEASTNMQVLIDDLLAYSRINTKAVELEEIDVRKLLDALMMDLDTVIKEKKAVINIEPMPKLLHADYSRIRQVFQNLITNAIKFIPADKVPVLDILYKDIGEYHQFKVKDNGIGIEEDYLENIFLMFKKLHSENKYQGTGIGLSICKKVIDQHKGNIWAESLLGEGSTFIFTINKTIEE